MACNVTNMVPTVNYTACIVNSAASGGLLYCTSRIVNSVVHAVNCSGCFIESVGPAFSYST
jgi:hypothetical protein